MVAQHIEMTTPSQEDAASGNLRSRGESTAPSFASVDEYVKAQGGSRAITSVLIANNGISAVKAIRSVRQWSYEMFADEHKVKFVCMATPEDLRANAEYIRMAEHVVEVPGGANNNNYANVTLIVEIAERFHVDAVWAGWGHASENPLLPDSLLARNIVFIGPPSKPMRALGDKIGSTIIAQSAKVPTIAWNGDGLEVNYKENDGIPEETYTAAMLKDGEHCLQECKRIGFPVMIKASEGGGGKGIRKVTDESQVLSAWEAVRGEIPGSPIFVMKLAPKSRHLEVQLLADAYGNAIALSGRDCSVQRRHQKIVEEGPVLAPSPQVWNDMMRAATRLAKEVQYVNAGTVEYLFSELPEDEGNAFFFLELNPRLQVEHPVTEMITHVNLPAAQLQVAMGIPLQFIPDVRRLYKKHPFGKTEIDFDTEEQAPPHGHVIAARITAEDPNAGFQPTSGSIQELNFRSTPDVWGYFSVDSSGQVHEFADSQIGHLFAWGTSRDRARKNMILALKELSIRGDIHTTVEYIVTMMESDDFKYNRIHTAWLDERIARHKEVRLQGRPDPLLVVLVGAVCSALQASTARRDEYVAQLERGQLPSPELLSQEEKLELIYEGIKYQLRACRSGDIQFTLFCNDSYVQVEARTLSDGGFLVLLNGKSHVAYATKEAQGLRLVLDGQTCVFTKEYDPTRLVTNTAGKLARYLVDDGASLRRGMPFAEIEVMKMYMPLLTPEDGVIRLLKSEGAVLAPGDCIATMELDDPSCVKKSEVFKGQLPIVDAAASKASVNATSVKALPTLRRALAVLQPVLEGYFAPSDLIDRAIADLFDVLQNPLLPVDELHVAMSPLAGRIPLDVFAKITDKLESFRKQEPVAGEFDVLAVAAILDEHKQTLGSDKAAADLEKNVATLREIIAKYSPAGLQSGMEAVLTDLLTNYFDVEAVYASKYNVEDAVLGLRQQHSDDLGKVFSIARSHQALDAKNKVLLALLSHMGGSATETSAATGKPRISADSAALMPLLEKLATFKENKYSLVALEARQLLVNTKMPSYRDRITQVEDVLRQHIADSQEAKESDLAVKGSFLLDRSQPLFDLLISLLDHEDEQIREAALELYVRRIYRTYELVDIHSKRVGGSEILAKTFEFKSSVHDALSVGKRAESYDDLAGLLRRNSSASEMLVKQGEVSTTTEESMTTTTSTDGETTTTTTTTTTTMASSSALEFARISSQFVRHGALLRLTNLESVKTAFADIIALFPERNTALSSKQDPPVNVMHVILLEEQAEEEAFLQAVEAFLASKSDDLRLHNIRRVTFAVRPRRVEHLQSEMALYPNIYTFSNRLGYKEDQIVRHMEAPLAYKLELRRLRSYDVSPLESHNKNVHLYLAKPKVAPAKKADAFQRIFVRGLVRQLDRDEGGSRSPFDAYPGPERTLVEALNALELHLNNNPLVKSGKPLPTKNNHVFLNILPEAIVNPQYLEGVIRILASRYAERLEQLRVSQVELKIIARFKPGASAIPVRLVASNPSGYVVRVEAYVEAAPPSDALSNGDSIFTSIGENHGELDGKPVTSAYPVEFPHDNKRELAKKMSNTVYVYDFLQLIEFNLKRIWRRFIRSTGSSTPVPGVLLETRELVLNADATAVEESTRPAGKNTIGMVAWKLTLFTPEYPAGRDIVIIANDITFKAGSFGTLEDTLFDLASKFARARGIPRLFFSANAGARIGMAEAVKALYKVCWKDASNPTKGFEYLYLTEEDYATLTGSDSQAQAAVNADKIVVPVTGEVRYVLRDVIGAKGERDLGVECLRGSGTIAGETARAYNEIFTLTYACGRSVGIGAYLVRLGQRTVQNATHSPIILTGYQALNKLMGRDVYTSNDQLGGVKIMHTNGVTHLTSPNHLEGVLSILEWLSFVPRVRGDALLPVREVGVRGDPVARKVEFAPEDKSTPYDPRCLLTGKLDDATNAWCSGLLDRDSFRETLDGWAKSVVVGRGRLGGIPLGVVVTEVRTSEKIIPADPAAPATQENVVAQAGQVWFPDSAHKTATAIRDFKGEDLPLLIIANWRGFSGGQRDMFDEVLKFGAAIVDALVDYSQPVAVYIPPFAELRGGAWAVVDPTINGGVMEMYADTKARGGVLEPAGLIEIKYRRQQLLETMHRLDDTLRSLSAKRAEAETAEEKAAISQKISAREQQLLPVYVQVATEFADLHDTPGRMKAVNCIREIVPWTDARVFLHARLQRRLAEFALRRELVKASHGSLTFAEGAAKQLEGWFAEAVNAGRVASASAADVADVWAKRDHDVLMWIKSDREWLSSRIKNVSREYTAAQVVELGKIDPTAAVAGVLELLHQLSDKDREEAVAALRRGSIFHH